MKIRRRYAFLLLAVLALLQVRVAFAACLNSERMSGRASAACCLEDMRSEAMMATMDQDGMVCAPQCLTPSNTADHPDLRMLVGAEVALPAAAQLLRSQLYPPLGAALQHTAREAVRPPHTRLIYVFQRLLI